MYYQLPSRYSKFNVKQFESRFGPDCPFLPCFWLVMRIVWLCSCGVKMEIFFGVLAQRFLVVSRCVPLIWTLRLGFIWE